jgi:hypothetical protein
MAEALFPDQIDLTEQMFKQQTVKPEKDESVD